RTCTKGKEGPRSCKLKRQNTEAPKRSSTTISHSPLLHFTEKHTDEKLLAGSHG
uniref:Uncharacterized protein n=1 Tax=Aegilops tauschii subsp. strangulata TaxID=200361 RepID=A0A453CKL2_AEGTS